MSAAFDALWKKYDSNADDKMDLGEFRKMVYSLGRFLNEEQSKAAFSLIDKDNNGLIDKSELYTFWQQNDHFERIKVSKDEHVHKIEEIGDYFRHHDKDHNGILDKSEFVNMCGDMTKNGYNLMTFGFDAIDKDGSGKIEFNEYLTFMVAQGALEKFEGTKPIHA